MDPWYVQRDVLRLDEEQDIEVVRRAAQLLEDENKKLIALVRKLKRRLAKLEGEGGEQLELQIAELERQLSNRNRALFGDSSEKRPRGEDEPAPTKPQTGHGPRPQPELPIVEREYVLDQADETCTKCGGQLREWKGQHEASEEIDVIERRFVLVKHKRKKYRCRCGGCIETAPSPLKLFQGARYSVAFAISVAISKYADHLPLERQVRMMRREGLRIDSQTLWDQLNALARVLAPTKPELLDYILSQPVIGADETTWRLMRSKKKRGGKSTKRWQVWTAAAPDAVCYLIQDSRSADAARNLLGDYQGTVLCDGYSAYESLRKNGGNFQLAHCWAHVRRKYIEVQESFPDQCNEVLALIGQLYDVERQCRAGPDGNEQRAKLRNDQARPLVKQIERWALSCQPLPQSGLAKAIAYMGGMWDKGLLRFLDDPAIPIDNNATERALRGIVLGRKNHYGSRSQRGTEVAALLYSLIESAKLADVGPATYLRAATEAALRDGSVLLPHQLA